MEAASTTIAKTLESIDKLIQDARESRALAKRLVDRLRFLLSELRKTDDLAHDSTTRSNLATRFTTTVNDVHRFLRKFAKKRALQRIAASRLIREGVRRLHSSIDIIFQDAGLSDAPEMTEWKQHEAADVQEQLERLQELVAISGAIVKDLSVAEVEEALLEIQLELKRRNNPKEFVALLTSALKHPEVAAKEGVVMWDLEGWFVRRDDVDMEEKPFDMGSFGDVFEAKLGAEGVKVCVKLLLVDGPDAQGFFREARIWHKLSHPNVIKMLGACHVGSPLFFVSELAKAGNFLDYLYKSANKRRMWRLFLQAAQGLSYLHSERVVHADIKCSNILVGDDGLAKLCDFGFSYIKTLSIGKSLKEQPSSVRWKAPECTLEQGPAAYPSFRSDVFSLGMSIIQAKTGKIPWGVRSEDEIIEAFIEGEGYPRPEGIFTDREWELVRGMTDFDSEKRWSLGRVIEALKELADEEAAVSEVQEEHGVAVTPVQGVFADEHTLSSTPVDATTVVTPVRLTSDVSESTSQAHAVAEVPDIMGQQQQASCEAQPHSPVISESLNELVPRSEATIAAIEQSLEEMCIEKRENSHLLTLLVAGLIQVARLAADMQVQAAEDVKDQVNAAYGELLLMLKQRAPSSTIFYRIASSRHALGELETLRQKLVAIDHLLRTSTDNGCPDWSSSWDECLSIRAMQLRAQLEDTRNLSEILLDETMWQEALTLLQYETKCAPVNDLVGGASNRELVGAAYDKVAKGYSNSGESIDLPAWFIPRYEVQYDEENAEGDGTFGAVYVGVWRTDRHGRFDETAVAVKVLLIHGLGGSISHRSFIRSLDNWFGRLDHPNVLKLYGASHVGRRAFLVLENADKGSLLEYISKSESNRSELWCLLHKAALGLAYLHANNVIHGHLKCANLLISSDGTVKVADFGFDGVRSAVNAVGHFDVPRTLPWIAPELLLDVNGKPTKMSDVYAFGMCIIEAVTGKTPWGTADDDEILEKLVEGEFHPRPEEFEDEQWDLVMQLCAIETEERASLESAIFTLKRFAEAAQLHAHA